VFFWQIIDLMKKWLPKLSSAAPATMYGITFLLLLPFFIQQAWVKNPKGANVVVPNSVPKISAKKKNSSNSIACLDEVRITLGADCAFKVTPGIVAEFNAIDCNPDGMELLITDKSGKAVANNRLTGEHAGQRLKYYLSHPICNPEGCWGIIAVEDKNMPRVDLAQFDTTPVICSKIDQILNNPKTIGHTTRTSSPRQLIPGTLLNYSEVEDNVPNLGIVKFANCDPECPLTIKWNDRLVVYGCDSLANNGLYARIFRTWVATNCQGKFIDTVQTIDVCRPAVSDFYFNGPDTLGYDRVVTYASCTPNKALIRRIDVTPFAIKKRGLSGTVTDTMFLDRQPCSYSMQVKDQEFPICEGKGLKIDRQIYVFDWCNGGIVDTFHVLIKIGDFEAPEISMPHHPIELSTGPINCEASIPLTVKGLKDALGIDVIDNCFLSSLSVKVKSEDLYTKGFLVATKGPGEPWFETPYPISNGVLSGLNPGRHWVIIDAFDACYNTVKDSVIITVADRISPIMVINDQLNVSLSNGLNSIRGYAKACVGDINEGSSDNCTLKWMKVRRSVPAACIESFIGKGYDSNNNGKLDPLPADGDWSKADGIDYDGDGKLASFGETFVLSEEGKLLTPLLPCADFFCCDLAAKVTVELWGEDNSGNRNFAWAEIALEDKIAPRCAAPYDATIFCNDKCIGSIDNPTAMKSCFGDVIVLSGNDCENIDTIYKVIKKLKCGVGTIERIWTITKQSSKGPMSTTCTQIIKVLPVHEYNICFPKDADQKTCAKPLVDSLIKDELACDLLTVNVIDKRYDASNDECYKIFRTFTVLNWCAYDDRCGDPMSVGNVYLLDRAVFNNYGKAPIYVLVRDKDRDGDEEFWLSQNLTPAENVDQRFTPPYCKDAYVGSELGIEPGEYFHSFMYTQIIKVYDEERPLVNIPKLDKIPTRTTDCKADAIINFTAKDNCTDKVELERAQLMVAPFQTLDPSLMIPFATPRWTIRESAGNAYQVTIRDLPEGKHDLIVVVRDECGNLSLPTRIPFEIRDLKGPAPICINGLSTDLMPDGNGGGMMAVWATDFVASKIYDCNGQGPETENGLKLVTKYSINRVGETPNVKQTGLNFTCADAGVTINVEIHAWDEAGNHDFCVTYLLLQDNRKVCPTGASYTGEISGLITTLDAEPLAGVNVQISGQQANQSQNSGATGKFNFAKLQLGGDFTLTPQYDKAHLNGVSTFDLVQIQKHILGTKLLTDPYQIIAADVNNSRTITTIDLIQVRKLVLGLDDRFASVPSWKFIPVAYKFPNPSNPWQEEFPQVISVNDLKDKASSDFVGIKMGDVNGSATSSSATAGALRSNQALHIKAERLNQTEQNFKAGESLTVALTSAELASVQGYQFTLNFDPKQLQLENLDYRSIKAENLGVFAPEGNITLSWYENGVQRAAEQTLLILHFKAKTAGSLSEVLRLNSRRTPAEAYTHTDEVIGVQLDWGNTRIIPVEALLQQNTPNPFKDETMIEFSLPEATQATLSIRDVAGRLLWSNSSLFAKGNNRINVKAEALQGNGVLYYTLDAAGFTATRKMIILD
jgi:large repetitive protein